MKILIVSPGFSGGGAEDIAINSANYYQKCGHEVTFCSFQSDGPARNRLKSDVHLMIIEAKSYFSLARQKRLSHETFDHTFSFIRHTNIASFVARCVRAIKTKKLHLIEVNTFDQQRDLYFLSRLWQNILLLFAYNFSDDVIAVSERVKGQIIEKYRCRKVRVIGNPCISKKHFQNFSRIVPKIKAGKPKKFVAAGRLHSQKGFVNLLKVFKKHVASNPGSTLTIYGEGKLRDQLEEFILSNRLECSIFLPGYTNNLTNLLVDYDAFILSSEYEGFGNVIILAFLAGLPCVAKKNTGGPDDLINPTNGILYGSNQELLCALEKLDLSDYPREKLWKIAQQYTIENICSNYIKIK